MKKKKYQAPKMKIVALVRRNNLLESSFPDSMEVKVVG